jgi:hypothetical protein
MLFVLYFDTPLPIVDLKLLLSITSQFRPIVLTDISILH